MKKATVIFIICCLAAALICGCTVPALPSTPLTTERTQPTQTVTPTTTPSTTVTVPVIQPNTKPATQPSTGPVLSSEETAYLAAETLLADGKTAEAAIAFGKLAGYADARERSFALWDEVAVRHTVAITAYHCFAVLESGKVVCSKGAYAIPDYLDIDYLPIAQADQWENIIAIDAYGDHIIGLHPDGTVSAICNGTPCSGTEDWTDIVSVAAGGGHFAGLKMDGTVVSTPYHMNIFADNISRWNNIIAIDATDNFTIALKAEGTVVTAGLHRVGGANVDNWDNVTKIQTSFHGTAALRSDGTVLYAGEQDIYETALPGWLDMTDLWIPSFGPIGKRADGTLAWIQSEHLAFLENWSEIVDIQFHDGAFIALRSDGTTCTAGFVTEEYAHACQWSNVCVP